MTSAKNEAREVFNVEPSISGEMERQIDRFSAITSGRPEWCNDEDDDITSINFASYIDSYLAGLVCLNMKVTVEGENERARALQKDAEYLMEHIVDRVGEALGNAGIMFKPNGENIDYIEAGDFVPLSQDSNGHILSCAFRTQFWKEDKKYTRWEQHEFVTRRDEDGNDKRVYQITNKAYVSDKSDKLGDETELSAVPEWADIAPLVTVEDIDQPLYAFFCNPQANNIDKTSPLGLPVWFNAINELRDLDIAWSRKAEEIADSRHITFVPQSAIKYAEGEDIKLPRFVKGLEMGTGLDDTVKDHVATLLTNQRIQDINATLGMISAKCGLSQNAFKLDEKQGLRTATEVEADDQETIRTVKNIRDALETTIEQLIYALDKFYDNGSGVPKGSYEVKFDFGDITYNYEEDRAMWLSYVLQGFVPKWKYLVKFERMTEEEAKALVQEAEGTPEEGLFAPEAE